jgi:hypothetical protein
MEIHPGKCARGIVERGEREPAFSDFPACGLVGIEPLTCRHVREKSDRGCGNQAYIQNWY